ncbi:MAG TPA: hypothetical protein VFR97_12075 [Capillimicrobium sp.]|nr:hypothetical protein [Capillimicrobium sp.]
MIRTATATAAALIAAIALPATAPAATPKLGTFGAEPVQRGVKGSRLSIGVTAKDTVSGIGFFWTCKGRKADHQTTISDDSGVLTKLKKGSFKITRDAYTVAGELPDLDSGEAKVTVTGTFVSAKKVVGTVSAKMGSCASGPLKYTATWEGPPVTGDA